MRRSPAESETIANDLSLREGAPPLTIYGLAPLERDLPRSISRRIAAALRGVESRVERVTVRFEDLNGPKGGIDQACRILLALSAEKALLVEARGESAAHAFSIALHRLTAAVDRQLSRRAARSRQSLRLAHLALR